jgi:hypothetical protein
MRNKELFVKKFSLMDSILERIRYTISRGEQDQGLQEVQNAMDLLGDMSTLLDNEYQDERY